MLQVSRQSRRRYGTTSYSGVNVLIFSHFILNSIVRVEHRFVSVRYTGRFPGKNAYQGSSKGKITQTVMADEEDFNNFKTLRNNIDNNRESQSLVHYENAQCKRREEAFEVRKHGQRACPKLLEDLVPGYTGRS